MNCKVVIRPQAQDELDDHAAFIHRDNPPAAARFLEAVRRTLERISRVPAIGATWNSDNPRLAGVRRLPVRGFRNYIIFYRRAGDVIDILHLLHGARDIPRQLEM